MQIGTEKMKTRFKTLRDPRKARAKQIDFEVRTRLKWDWYSTGDGAVFTPIVTNDTPMASVALMDILENHLISTSVGFIKLSDITGMPLTDILSAAKSLVQRQKAIPEVNRHGHFAGIRSKR